MPQTLPRLTILHPDGSITYAWEAEKKKLPEPRSRWLTAGERFVTALRALPSLVQTGREDQYATSAPGHGRGHGSSQWVADAHRGTPYLVSQRELDILQDADDLGYKRRRLPRPITCVEAHRCLARLPSQHLTDRQRAAWQRLRRAYDIPLHQTTPDLYIKLLHDLDTLLFSTTLNRRLLVSWVSSTAFRGRTEFIMDPSGLPPPRRAIMPVRYAHIKLAKQCFRESRKRDLWGTLVHEMLHAYLAVSTQSFGIDTAGQYRPAVEGRTWDVLHGPMFEGACEVLAHRLNLPGLRGEHVFGRDDWRR